MWQIKTISANFLRSVFLMANLGLCFKIRSTAISIVSFNGMLVKRLLTSKEISNLLLKSKLLNSSTKEKESLTEYLSGKKSIFLNFVHAGICTHLLVFVSWTQRIALYSILKEAFLYK